MKQILVFLFFGWMTSLFAQDASNIKTVQIQNTQSPYSRFIFELNEPLLFSFDDLDADQKTYSYNVTHYTKDWEKSNLNSTQYLDGFETFEIQQFENSFNTLQPFTHYSFSLPNENTRIKISGNYKIQIVDEYDEVVCERKIVVFENLCPISVQVTETRDLEFYNQKQLVDLEANITNIQSQSKFPKDEIQAIVYQNHDFNFSSPFISHTFNQENQLIYRGNSDTDFYAHNEFLHFDTKDLLSLSRFVARSTRENELFDTYLFTNTNRALTGYTYQPDINGGFVVRNIRADDPKLEADYSWVYFSLRDDNLNPTDQIYVYGAFNNYALNNPMSYNKENDIWETRILIKQGFVNYDYVVKKDHKIDRSVVGGNYFDTENSYQALLYFTPFGGMYTRVVGFGEASSLRNRGN